MLNRTEILEKLFHIRKSIYNRELLMEDPPSIDDIKLKKSIDELINDIIGDFLTNEDQEQMDQIILKAISDEISIEVAMVAIREIVESYFKDNSYFENSYKNDETLNNKAASFKEGYR